MTWDLIDILCRKRVVYQSKLDDRSDVVGRAKLTEVNSRIYFRSLLSDVDTTLFRSSTSSQNGSKVVSCQQLTAILFSPCLYSFNHPLPILFNMSRFVRPSKYRHTYSQQGRKENNYENLKVSPARGVVAGVEVLATRTDRRSMIVSGYLADPLASRCSLRITGLSTYSRLVMYNPAPTTTRPPYRSHPRHGTPT